MIDIYTGEISKVEGGLKESTSIITPEDTELDIALREQRNSTETTSKVQAFNDAMKISNIATYVNRSAMFNNYTRDKFKEDSEWKSNMDNLSASNMLIDNKLPLTYENVKGISESNNREHALWLMEQYHNDIETMNDVNKKIGKFAQGTAKIVSEEVLNPKALLIPSVLRAGTVGEALVASSAYETARFMDDVYEDRDIGALEDRVAFGVASVGIDMAFAKMFNISKAGEFKIPNEIAEETTLALPAPMAKLTDGRLTPEELLSKSALAEERVAKASIQAEKEFKQSLITPVGESPSFVKQLDRERTIQNEKFKSDMDELDNMIATATKFEEDIIPERYATLDEYAKMREKAAQYRQELELEKNVKVHEESQSVKINAELEELRKVNVEEARIKIENSDVIPDYIKRTLIKHLDDSRADEIKLAKTNEKLKTLGARESEINSELNKLNTKLNSYVRNSIHKTNTQNKIDALHNELASVRNSIKQVKNPTMNMAKAERTANIKLAEENLMVAGLMHNDMAKVVEGLRPLVSKGNVDMWRTLKGDVELLASKYPAIFNALKRDVNNLIKNKDINDIKSKALNKLPKNKKIAMVGVLAALATSANASEGTDDNTPYLSIVFGIGTALILGHIAINQIKNVGFKNLLSSKLRDLDNTVRHATYNVSPQASRFELARRKFIAGVSGEFINSYSAIAKFGGKAKEVIDKLGHNAFGGNKVTASIRKFNMLKSAQARIGFEYKVQKANYIKERGYSIYSRFTDTYKIEDEFNKAIADVLEGGSSTSKAVNAMAKQHRAEYDLIKSKLIDAGYDADFVNNYFPRRWNVSSIRNMININKALNEPIIEQAFTDAILSGGKVTNQDAARSIAKSMIERMMKIETGSERQYGMYDDLFKDMEEFLQTGVSKEDIANKLSTKKKDMMDALQARQSMDLNRLDNLQIYDANGLPLNKLQKDMFVERDANKVFEEYANVSYGHIAMSEQGYHTVHRFMNDVNEIRGLNGNVPADELKRIGNQIFGTLEHRVEDVYTQGLNILTSVAMGLQLAKGGFSVLAEATKLLVNSNYRTLSNGIAMSWKGMDNALMKKLLDLTPLGTSKYRDIMPERFFGNEIDNLAFKMGFNEDKVVGKMLEAGGKRFVREVVGKMGLGWFSDFTQRVNVVQSATKLANFIERGEGLALNRLEYYGLDTVTINKLKGYFELDSKGQLINIKKMPKNIESKYQAIMRQLTNEKTPEPDIANYPSFLDNNPVGKIFASLLRYSFTAFNVNGLVDVAMFDRTALIQSIAGTVGSYIGLKIKFLANNKDVDDATIMKYALLSQSIGGAVSVPEIFMKEPVSMKPSQLIIETLGANR